MSTSDKSPFPMPGTVRGQLPDMKRAFNGARPERVSLAVNDDASGSGARWASVIEQVTNHLVKEMEQRFITVKWDYVAMRDTDIGEEDEYRLRGSTGADLLREQKLIVRKGGGDAPETFSRTVENQLSDPGWMVYTGGLEALGLVMFTTSDTKPALYNSLTELGAELKRRNIKLFVIGTPGTNMEELVHAADGFFFPLNTSPTDAEAREIVAKLAATVKSTMGAAATSRGTARPAGESGFKLPVLPCETLRDPPRGDVGPVGRTVAVG